MLTDARLQRFNRRQLTLERNVYSRGTKRYSRNFFEPARRRTFSFDPQGKLKIPAHPPRQLFSSAFEPTAQLAGTEVLPRKHGSWGSFRFLRESWPVRDFPFAP